jgi:hypothetical protein
MNVREATMKDVYEKFGLEPGTRDFIGHSMALYQDDEYISEPGMAEDAISRIRLYVNSMARYGKSPYIYPLYGLGELPQGFARLSAIYGGTYMLNTNVDEIVYEKGKAAGIKATMKDRDDKGEGMSFETKCKMIVADPSYFPKKVRVTSHVLKAICILDHPVDKTDNSDSLQLILPQSQIGRKHGAYFARLETQLTQQTSTWPSCRRRTPSAPRGTTSPSCPPSPRATRTTTSSCSRAWTDWAASSSASWARRSPSTSRWRAAARTACTSARATTRRATSRPRPVRA